MKVKLTTSKGDITIALHQDKTPKTVENFLSYVKSGFYEKTIFHRVIPGFVVQGGGLSDDMNNKETEAEIENEAKTGGQNKRGTLAMARTPAPHSASSQFFFNLRDNGFLDFRSETNEGFGYCVFAEVVEGMDVVDAMAEVETTHRLGHDDVPAEPIYIEACEVMATEDA